MEEINVKDFKGFESSSILTFGERVEGVGNAMMVLQIIDKLITGDRILISLTIGGKKIGEFIASTQYDARDFHNNIFSCKGTPEDIAVALAKSINSYNLKKFKNLKPKKDTHRYTIKPESKATYDPAGDGSDDLVNYYTKYVSQFLRLSSNYSNFPVSDFALGTIYSNLSITAEFVTNDELSVFVNTTSSDVLWPSEFTIKITDKADIPSIKGFLNGTDEGSEGEDTRDPDSEVEGGTGEGI